MHFLEATDLSLNMFLGKWIQMKEDQMWNDYIRKDDGSVMTFFTPSNPTKR